MLSSLPRQASQCDHPGIEFQSLTDPGSGGLRKSVTNKLFNPNLRLPVRQYMVFSALKNTGIHLFLGDYSPFFYEKMQGGRWPESIKPSMSGCTRSFCALPVFLYRSSNISYHRSALLFMVARNAVHYYPIVLPAFPDRSS